MYRYLGDIATADVAFRATGKTLEEVFVSAADATLNVMVDDVKAVTPRKRKTISLSDENVEMLLFQFLQELVYYKDAQQLLLRALKVTVRSKDQRFFLCAACSGEKINPQKHKLLVDIKAVTLHRLKVKKTKGRWQATVVLDI